MSTPFPGLIGFSRLVDRPQLTWPEDKGVAFCPVVVVEHYETAPPQGSVQAGDLGGGLHALGAQFLRVGNRDYGHRVGFWRMAQWFAEHDVTPTLAIDAMAAEKYPQILAHAVDSGWEVVCHGIAITRAVSGAMPLDTERAYLVEAKSRVEQAAGVATRGWFGPSYGESVNTLSLLAEVGFSYDLDWANDEQPYLAQTEPPLAIMPMSAELDDNTVVLSRGVSPFEYAEMLEDSATRLAEDSATTGRYLAFALNPYISGMPWRFKALSASLEKVLALPQVWATRPGVAYDAYRAATAPA